MNLAIMSALGVVLALALSSCTDKQAGGMSALQAKTKAQQIIAHTEVLADIDPGALVAEQAFDIDGDGYYEVAFSESVEGSMGSMGPYIFRLRNDSLRLMDSSKKMCRSRGAVRLLKSKAIVTHPEWGPTDPNCCPTLSVTEVYRLDERFGFIRLSIDTTATGK